MSQAPSIAFAAVHADNLAGVVASPSAKAETVSLRGTTRGLEILVSGTPSTAALGARLTELLAEAPAFFAGSSARVAIDGALPCGALACLEEVATRFQVRIVEIGPVAVRRRRPHVPAVLRPDDVPQVNLAEGTGPITDEAAELRGREPASAGAALPADGTGVTPADATPLGCSTSELAPSQLAPAPLAPGQLAPAPVAPSQLAPGQLAPAEAAPAQAVPAAAPGTGTGETAAQLASVATAMAAETAAVPPGRGS